MYKLVAVAAELGIFENHYVGYQEMLVEARCQCSGKKKPCPTVLGRFQEASLDPSNELLRELAFEGLEGILIVNRELIVADPKSVEVIGIFLKNIEVKFGEFEELTNCFSVLNELRN